MEDSLFLLREFELEALTLHQLVVADTIFLQGLVSERHRVDIYGLGGRVVGLYSESTLGGIDLNLVKHGGGKGIEGFARAIGVKPHHRKYGPGGHSAGIVIAGDAVGSCCEMFSEQVADSLLSAPFLTRDTTEKIGIRDIRLVGWVVESFIKYLLELVGESFLAAVHFYKSLNIMRHEEGIVPGGTLMETGHGLEVLTGLRVKGVMKVPSILRGRRVPLSVE